MVKLGFIVEGDTEKILLDSQNFRNYLDSISLSFVPDVINAGGNGNLLPHNIGAFTQRLIDQGAEKIIILTDLDKDVCITSTKERINPEQIHLVALSIKQLEAWFLADTVSMKSFLDDPGFVEDSPESIDNPYARINELRIQKSGRGIRRKSILARQMIDAHNFSILNAAKHPNCNSAKYFLKTIESLTGSNP